MGELRTCVRRAAMKVMESAEDPTLGYGYLAPKKAGGPALSKEEVADNIRELKSDDAFCHVRDLVTVSLFHFLMTYGLLFCLLGKVIWFV
jgi:hypothetical protein